MKMKRLWAWLLVLTMCVSLVACAPHTNDDSTHTTQSSTTATSTSGSTAPTQNNEQQTPDVPPTDTPKPLLYRVTDTNGHVVWLFGSIHVGRESYYPLPDYVMDAFESAHALAVELDIVAFEKDPGQQIKALSQLVYLDGSKIKDHIPSELYDKAVAILKEYRSYMSTLDMYYPAFWGSTIQSLVTYEFGGDPTLGIDRHLINAAYEAKKEILEIESGEIQYKMLADFDEEIQWMLLASAVEMYENKEEAADELTFMMDLWASGDEEAFAAYLCATDETLPENEKQLLERYNQAMITSRNLTMTAYAEAVLAEGKETFICVGAAHVVGDGAMAELLAQRGYSVECITA